MAEIPDSITPLADRLEELEKSLKAFNRETSKQLTAKLATLGLRDKAEIGFSKLSVLTFKNGSRKLVKEKFLFNSVSAYLQKKQGDITGVAVSFARHGIFVERGVGKHRPVRSSAANRYSRPWLYPILSERLDVLADMLQEEYTDIAIEQVRLLIPGIIDIKIE